MTPDLLPRNIAAKIAVQPDGCWIWTASVNSKGYGVACPGPNGFRQLAHRFTYTQLVDAIPDGLQIDHLCRVRLCCNPAHLEPVTAGENQRRAKSLITHCPHGHEYTPENTYWHTKKNSRMCRQCRRDYMARQRDRRAA